MRAEVASRLLAARLALLPAALLLGSGLVVAGGGGLLVLLGGIVVMLQALTRQRLAVLLDLLLTHGDRRRGIG